MMPIDFKKIAFDPNKQEHIAQVEAEIKKLNQLFNSLIVLDLEINAPLTGSVLLWWVGVYGLMLEASLATCFYLWLYFKDKLNERANVSQAFQEQLHRMVEIFQKMVIDNKGYHITENKTVSDLVKAIAPYVDTRLLWSVGNSNADELPESFKTILTTSPHRVPLPLANEDQSNDDSVSQQVTNYLVKKIMPSSFHFESDRAQSGLQAVYGLFSNVQADVVKARYGYEDKKLKVG